MEFERCLVRLTETANLDAKSPQKMITNIRDFGYSWLVPKTVCLKRASLLENTANEPTVEN